MTGRWAVGVAGAMVLGVLGAAPAEAVTRPNTTIKVGPTGQVASSTVTFRFKSSRKGSTFTCRMDGGRWKRCSSPAVYTNLRQGAHSFSVRARKDGQVDRTPARRAFIVDTVAPQTTLLTGPDAVTADHSPTFAFASSEAATFSCRLDTVAFTPCASPFTVPDTPDEVHTFAVVARDAAGNADRTPASSTFEILTPVTRDQATAEAAADYYVPADADVDMPASCGSPAIDCPAGLPAPPTDQVHLTSTRTVTEVIGASRFDVELTADVSSVAPILVTLPFGDCNLALASASGAVPTWTIQFPLSFLHPPDSTEWRIVPGDVVITHLESADVVLSGGFGCSVADLGIALFTGLLTDAVADALIVSSLCAARGPDYLGPCP